MRVYTRKSRLWSTVSSRGASAEQSDDTTLTLPHRGKSETRVRAEVKKTNMIRMVAMGLSHDATPYWTKGGCRFDKLSAG